MGTRRRYWVISSSVAATLLIAGTVAHAPAARAVFGLPGGSIRAIPPVEVEDLTPTEETYVLVDEVIGRAGADGGANAGDWKIARDEKADKEVVVGRRPGRGNALGTLLANPFFRPEPVTFVHAAAAEKLDLPPLKPATVYVAYSFSAPSFAGSGRSSGATPPSESVGGGDPNDPTTTTTPPPSVGSGAPSESPVPEPSSACVLAALAAAALKRRR